MCPVWLLLSLRFNLSERHAAAAAILDEFADSTGLASSAPPRRYLWTDAFAAITWLGLHERTGEPRFLELAGRMVAQVHEVLGRHRDDDPRRGWISGLDEAQGIQHPTAGGLRIGKPLPERAPGEPYDSELEWERDGQYYHYLTRWLHALEQMARVSADERYRRWARELMAVAHRHFAYPAGRPERLYWKMSIDLSRALVASMGMHDPLDGLIAAASLGLEREAGELERICAGRRWATDDPLGAGGLLLDALGLARLQQKELRALFTYVLSEAAQSAEAVVRLRPFDLPAAGRLAFRELGFALGLHALAPLAEHADVGSLARFVPLGRTLEDFWREPGNQAGPSWTAHRDINAVTLAACLAPEGALR
jgi:hypothetical protein